MCRMKRARDDEPKVPDRYPCEQPQCDVATKVRLHTSATLPPPLHGRKLCEHRFFLNSLNPIAFAIAVRMRVEGMPVAAAGLLSVVCPCDVRLSAEEISKCN